MRRSQFNLHPRQQRQNPQRPLHPRRNHQRRQRPAHRTDSPVLEPQGGDPGDAADSQAAVDELGAGGVFKRVSSGTEAWIVQVGGDEMAAHQGKLVVNHASVQAGNKRTGKGSAQDDCGQAVGT